MDTADARALVARLAGAFRARLSEETITVWLDHVRWLTQAEALAALRRIEETSTRFPTIAEFREAVGAERAGRAPEERRVVDRCEDIMTFLAPGDRDLDDATLLARMDVTLDKAAALRKQGLPLGVMMFMNRHRAMSELRARRIEATHGTAPMRRDPTALALLLAPARRCLPRKDGDGAE